MIGKVLGVAIISVVLYAAGMGSLAIPFFLIGLVVVAGWEAMRQVPQQQAWVVERLGKFHSVLEPGLNWITPFLDKVSYRHSLKETAHDVPEQVCITKDNTQLGVDGIIYYQVTDPKLASYGSSNYIDAVTQLAQTTLRSEIGKMELDKTFESSTDTTCRLISSRDSNVLSSSILPISERSVVCASCVTASI